MGKKKIVLFGAGGIFRMFMKMCDPAKVDILIVCDNDIHLQGTTVHGIKICRPDEINRLDYDYIIITSSHFEPMKQQLVMLGCREETILNFYEMYQRLSLCNDTIAELMKEEVFFSMAAQLPYGEKFLDIKGVQEKNLFLTARILINSTCDKHINSLEEVEFQVFSQFGEDGIIQWLIRNVRLEEKTFVEFGVEDYTEANTRFLLMNNNWTGLIIDGSQDNIDQAKNWRYFWKYDLTAVAEFITRDNINRIITESGFHGEIGLLSIDVDGNDYWILNSISCINPRILICEYNNIFGADIKVSTPYDEKFVRAEKHYSNLYWGASIGALCDWASRNNYYYVGSNSAGNNAFFVRKDCMDEDRIPVNSKSFVECRYRESRDKAGCLTYLRRKECLKTIREMELVNLENGRIELIADIYHI